MVNLIIDNKEVQVPKGTTIIEAAKKIHIKIPSLCHHPDQTVKGNCRICLVENDWGKLVAACSTKVSEGMKIKTNTKFVRDTQKGVLELILANHNQDCLKCDRNGNCELQDLCERFNISNNSLDENIVEAHEIDDFNCSIVRDYSKCIKCGRCADVCREVQNVDVLAATNRGAEYEFIPRFDRKLHETECVFCGQCIKVCPVGAIYEKSSIDKVLTAIDDEALHVIVQIAPAVRVSVGELFNLEPGSITEGQIVSSLKRIGFERVFDTNFSADLTIIEEGYELIDRITNGGKLPMITSCSPGWINYVEGHGEDLLGHLSTCKSPQQMFGAISKTYYAEKLGIHPSKIFTVSIMPCTAKKFEANREEMNSYGFPDVDAVLTTRELGRLIKSQGIDFANVEEEAFDAPFGIASGAGAIFGASGGVMEAALRSVYEILTKQELEKLEFEEVRGMQGIKEATVNINGNEVKVAVVHGLGNAKKVMEEIREGKSDYTFVEIMGCTGGCIGGGGQPIEKTKETKQKRMDALYTIDNGKEHRSSHKNPTITKLYEEFLGEPNGHKAHVLLHTTYKGIKL
ncbi:NADH-dependent [FeFe] hydrogenase, group A6 [Fusobacteria bacterium ZRK30]|nr:NADH-dependent [FeFe] hydrogenase, group A6 [Fusobacteria bacterium ZRK30]